jgi:hypothetical protein
MQIFLELWDVAKGFLGAALLHWVVAHKDGIKLRLFKARLILTACRDSIVERVWLERERFQTLVNGEFGSNFQVGVFVAKIEAMGVTIAFSITGLGAFRELIAFYQGIGWI